MTRTERLRQAKNWAQHEMAGYLGVSQPTVARLEGGQAETGPVSRLLDLLEAQVSPPAAPNAAGTSAGAGSASPAASSSGASRDAA